MKVLGLRAEPNGFNWAVCDGTKEVPVLLAVERVATPRDYDEPEGLSDLGARLRAILTSYSPAVVGLRTPEAASPGTGDPARKRLRVEGVILATCAEAHLTIAMAALTKIGASLGVKSAKALLESDQYQQLNWASYPKPKREAILIGISLLSGVGDGDHSSIKI
jgi:hypothetical protein